MIHVLALTMGHDHHFLSRLERVSLPHIERAMTLYRDPELLLYIFQEARVPDGADRVAISLLDPERGPFLIVQRNGHFVTCLGEDMSPGDLPRITRGRLDAITDKMTDLRARLALAEQLTGSKSEVGKILERLSTAGRELSREEFTAIAAWQSVLCGEFASIFGEAAVELSNTRRELRLRKHLRQQELPTLRWYWNTYFMLGHLALLVAAGSREAELPAMRQLVQVVYIGLVQCGTLGASVRAAWAMGKFGKRAVPYLKEMYLGAKGIGEMIRACLGLVAIGARHGALRGELRKLLARTPPQLEAAGRPGPLDLLDNIRTLFGAAARPEEFERGFRQQCGERFLALTQAAGMQEDSPYRFQSADQVPLELCAATVADSLAGTQGQTSSLFLCYLSVPPLAPLVPEALYFPQALQASFKRRFCYADAESLLQTHDQFIGKEQPLRAILGPGRNEPCPCQSGKKYKRCCGFAAGSSTSVLDSSRNSPAP